MVPFGFLPTRMPNGSRKACMSHAPNAVSLYQKQVKGGKRMILLLHEQDYKKIHSLNILFFARSYISIKKKLRHLIGGRISEQQ